MPSASSESAPPPPPATATTSPSPSPSGSAATTRRRWPSPRSGSGSIRLRINPDAGTIAYTVRYANLEGTVTQSHIHFGSPSQTRRGQRLPVQQPRQRLRPARPPARRPTPARSAGRCTAADVIGPARPGHRGGRVRRAARGDPGRLDLRQRPQHAVSRRVRSATSSAPRRPLTADVAPGPPPAVRARLLQWAHDRPPRDLPPLEELLAGLRVVAIPMRVRFRGVTVREAALLQGPSGWGEFSPVPRVRRRPSPPGGWPPPSRPAGASWPAPRRDSIPVNATVPAVAPDQVRRRAGPLRRRDDGQGQGRRAGPAARGRRSRVSPRSATRWDRRADPGGRQRRVVRRRGDGRAAAGSRHTGWSMRSSRARR